MPTTLDKIKASAKDINSKDSVKRSRAQEIKKRYEAGMFNDALVDEGAQPVPIKPLPPRPVDIQDAFKGQEEGLQTLAPTLTPGQEFGEDLKRDVAKAGVELGRDINERGQNVIDIFKSDENPFLKGTRLVTEVLGGAVDIAERGVQAAVTAALPEHIEAGAMEKLQELLETPGGQAASQAIAGGIDKWNSFKENNPALAAPFELAFNVAELLTIGVGGPVAGKALKEGAEVVAETTAKVVEKGTEVVGDVVETTAKKVEDVVATRQVTKEAAKAQAESDLIRETIAPGLNAKEVRKAVSEGRATRGEQSFFFGKKPDVVEVDDRVKEISDTIQRRIPDASKADDFTLNNNLKTEIETIATDIQPKMQEVNLRDITPTETPIVKVAKQFDTEDEFIGAFTRGEMDVDTVEFIKREFGDDVLDDPEALRDLYKRSQNPSMIDVAFNAWDRIKKRQQGSVEFTEFAGAKRFQEIFEGHLNKLRKGTGEKNLDDLWKIRKDYDNSIPDRVKQANDTSPISSQIQKDMWLENRRILNDIINDSVRGLGSESQEAFKDMSNLYSARQNIIGKAKLDVKGKPGALGKAKEAVLDRAVPFGVGGFIF